MNKHAHFDLASAEKALRDGIRNTMVEALRLASSDDARHLVRLQADLEDFSVAFALWDMGRINKGGERADPIAASALGYMVGNLVASFVQNSGGGDEFLDLVMESLCVACNARLSGELVEEAVNSQVTVDAMQGGNA